MRPGWYEVCVVPERCRERGERWQLGVWRAPPETPLHQGISVCASWGERTDGGAGEKGPGLRDHPHPSILPRSSPRPRGGQEGHLVVPRAPQGRLRWEPGCREVLERLGFVFQDLPTLPLCGSDLPLTATPVTHCRLLLPAYYILPGRGTEAQS